MTTTCTPASTLDLWDVSLVQVLFACMSVLTFVELCIRLVKLCCAWCSLGPLIWSFGIAMAQDQPFLGLDYENPYHHLWVFEKLCACLIISGMS
jgi:hypothetical protein